MSDLNNQQFESTLALIKDELKTVEKMAQAGEGESGVGQQGEMTPAGKKWADSHIYTDDPSIASEASKVVDDMVKSAVQTVKSRGLMSANDEEFLKKIMERFNEMYLSFKDAKGRL